MSRISVAIEIAGAVSNALKSELKGGVKSVAAVGAAVKRVNAARLDIKGYRSRSTERKQNTALAAKAGARFPLASSRIKAKMAANAAALSEYDTRLKRAGIDTRRLDTETKKLAFSLNALRKASHIKVRLDSALEEMRAKREQLGKAMLGGALVAATVAMPVKAAIDMESAMADVKKVVSFDSADEFKAFQKDILAMTRTIPLLGTELATITASGGQLGIAKKDLKGFTETVAQMKTAFDMSAEDAGDSGAKLMNIYKLNLSGLRTIGDAVNHISDNSAAKAGQIVNVMKRIGGTAKDFGLSAQQSAALAGSFIALGKGPEIASTGINAMLMKLKAADKQG